MSSMRLESAVSVIVPVFNDANRLARCLRALSCQQTSPDVTFEVVVADNGSTDDVHAAAAPFAFATVVEEIRPGSYQARNRAAEAARGTILAFTDSDCVPDRDWVERAARSLEGAHSNDVVVGDIHLFAEADHSDPGVVAYERATAFLQAYYARVLHFGPTANLVMSRATFDHVGGFDGTRRSGGDKEFGQRAYSRGHAVRFDGSVRVAHPLRANLASLEHKTRRIVGGDHAAAEGRRRRHASAFVRYALLRPLKATWLVLRADGLRTSERVSALRTVAYVARWQLDERIRLLRGSEARR